MLACLLRKWCGGVGVLGGAVRLEGPEGAREFGTWRWGTIVCTPMYIQLHYAVYIEGQDLHRGARSVAER